jgi:hypothetical protein
MANPTKLYNEAFLTGCDSGHEWILPWFLKNFKKHCKKPLVFADFGLSDLGRAIIRENAHAVMDLTDVQEKGWFKKPLSMLKCPAKKTVWIDTDCQVMDNVDDIFNLLEPNKLAMVEDKPWTWRRGHLWHNSGVVGFIDKPIILRQWVGATKKNSDQIGDQEVLDKLLSPITKISLIKDLPNEWNVLRLQLDDGYVGKIRIMHWTGQKGKDKIRSML